MNLTDFRDIYNSKDVEYIKAINKKRIGVFLDFIIKERPDYLKKLKSNKTLEAIFPLMERSINVRGCTRNFGGIVNVLSMYKDEKIHDNLRWAIFLYPIFPNTNFNAAMSRGSIRALYAYLRAIGFNDKKSKDIMRYYVFFKDDFSGIRNITKKVMMIFGKKNIAKLYELKKCLIENVKSSNDNVKSFYFNREILYYDNIKNAGLVYSISQLPIRKDCLDIKCYNKKIVGYIFLHVYNLFLTGTEYCNDNFLTRRYSEMLSISNSDTFDYYSLIKEKDSLARFNVNWRIKKC